jgi:phosphatidylinositol-3-phosphatase
MTKARLLIVSAFLVSIVFLSVGIPGPVRPTADAARSQTSTPTATSTQTGMPAGIAYLPLLAHPPLPTVTPSATPLPGDAIPPFSHIFTIVMENTAYEQIIGNRSAPYMNSLAQHYGLATNYYGITHPSLPNYIAMLGGDTLGFHNDCTTCFVNAPNLVDQLERAGKSWKAYMEDMPSPCFIGDAGTLYRQKHNPFIYFDNIRQNPVRCNKIVPFTQFATDLQANSLPNYVWITPNMCHDIHDCPIASGDAWLQTWVPQILASPAWQQNGVLFILFDESKASDHSGCCQYASGGHVLTLVLSPLGKPAYHAPAAYNHYSLLRTIAAAWGLPPLGHAGCACSLPMTDFFATVPARSRP